MTRTTSVLGSPYYMSPEQMAQPKTIDLRTDIWSLGVILYELATQYVPFQGDTLAELVLKVHQQEPPPMTSWRPDVPEAYQALVARCLQKDRNLRFSSAKELAAVLAMFDEDKMRAYSTMAVDRTQLAPPPGPTTGAHPSAALRGSTKSTEGWSETIGGRKRSSGAVLLIAAGALVLLGVVVIVSLRLFSGHASAKAADQPALVSPSPVAATTPTVEPSPPVPPTPQASPTAANGEPAPVVSTAPVASINARTPAAPAPRPAPAAKPGVKPKPPAAATEPPAPRKDDDILQP
jgi:serine/threonine-protein kinase